MRMSDGVLVVLIIMLGIFAPLSTDMFLPALDEMVEFFGTTESTMSMALYMFMLFLAFGVLFLGPVSDKYGRRNVLIASMALYIAASIACSIVPTIELMILSRMLQAVGAGGGMATSVALVRDCFDGSKRKRVLAIVAVVGVLGPVLAPVLGQVIIWYLNWQATFWAPAVAALVCLLISLALPSDIPKERYSGSIFGAVRTMGPILRNGDFRRFCIMMNMVAFCILAYVSVSEYIYKGKGFDVGDYYSLYLASAMIVGVVGMIVISKVAKDLSNRGHLKVMFVLTLVSVVLMWTVAGMHPLLFLIAVVPIITVSAMTRSFGYNMMLSQDIGNSGAISSVLNFVHFVFATLGMVVVINLPTGNYMESVALCFTMFLAVYAVLWLIMIVRGTTLKGFE